MFSRFRSLFQTVKTANISILGPSKVGKTTLIRFLETDQPVEEESLSTLGVDVRKKPVKMGNWSFKLIDVGGQKVYQDVFWEMIIKQSDAIIYVIDATVHPEIDQALFDTHIEQYNYFLKVSKRKDVIMLLLNKQDLIKDKGITGTNFHQYYPVEELMGRSFAFHATSAKYGQGIDEAVNWFISALDGQQGS